MGYSRLKQGWLIPALFLRIVYGQPCARGAVSAVGDLLNSLPLRKAIDFKRADIYNDVTVSDLEHGISPLEVWQGHDG